MALLFLLLGATTTLSLEFAAWRLADDGALSAVDWFRIVIVAIVAAAFGFQFLVALGRLPGLRRLRRMMRREAQPHSGRRLAVIPSVRLGDRRTPLPIGYGRLGSVERSRARTQQLLDTVFWIGVCLALLVFGTLAAYGLGSSAMRSIANGSGDGLAFVRALLAAVMVLGLVRLLRTAIGQLRRRRRRRRRKAVRRMLRYLLWWDRPDQVMGATTGIGPMPASVSPFLICCGIAATAAAFAPWGDAPAAGAIGDPTTVPITSSTSVPAEPTTTLIAADRAATTTTTAAVDPTPATTAPTASPPTTAATTTSTTTMAATTTTTVTTTTVTTTTTTTVVTTTTTSPAPPMVIDQFDATFTCDGGTTNFILSWNVTGDPAGQIDIYRNHTGGSFAQIGFEVAFDGQLIDTPQASGDYQYWLIANNSDFADETSVRDVGSVDTNCVE